MFLTFRYAFFDTKLILSQHPQQVFYDLKNPFLKINGKSIIFLIFWMFLHHPSKFGEFSLKISGEIIWQSWPLLTTFFNFRIVHCMAWVNSKVQEGADLNHSLLDACSKMHYILWSAAVHQHLSFLPDCICQCTPSLPLNLFALPDLRAKTPLFHILHLNIWFSKKCNRENKSNKRKFFPHKILTREGGHHAYAAAAWCAALGWWTLECTAPKYITSNSKYPLGHLHMLLVDVVPKFGKLLIHHHHHLPPPRKYITSLLKVLLIRWSPNNQWKIN